jgi:hypothetical protein
MSYHPTVAGLYETLPLAVPLADSLRRGRKDPDGATRMLLESARGAVEKLGPYQRVIDELLMSRPTLITYYELLQLAAFRPEDCTERDLDHLEEAARTIQELLEGEHRMRAYLDPRSAAQKWRGETIAAGRSRGRPQTQPRPPADVPGEQPAVEEKTAEVSLFVRNPKTGGGKKDSFHIRFRGVDRPKVKGVGLDMIYVLLRNPITRPDKKGLHVLKIDELMSTDRPSRFERLDGVMKGKEDGEEEEEGAEVGYGVEPWTENDEASLAAAREMKARREEEIANNTSADRGPKSDWATSHEALALANQLIVELERKKYRRPPPAAEETRKAYDRLRDAYDTALEILTGIGLGELAGHFRNHIKFGNELGNYCYGYLQTDDAISWSFEEPAS